MTQRRREKDLYFQEEGSNWEREKKHCEKEDVVNKKKVMVEKKKESNDKKKKILEKKKKMGTEKKYEKNKDVKRNKTYPSIVENDFEDHVNMVDIEVDENWVDHTAKQAKSSIGGKNLPKSISPVPFDNVSFHYEKSAVK